MNGNDRKVLLILAPSNTGSSKSHMPPLGLAYLAGALNKHGISYVRILDLMLYADYEDKLCKELREFEPDICGISFATPNRLIGFNICKIIKEHTSTLLVAGGPHVSNTEEDTLKNVPAIDVIVRGEGEATFTDIVVNYDNLSLNYLENIKGISYRNESGEIIINADREFMSPEDISNLVPSYDLLELGKYDVRIPGTDNVRTINILSQRGCPHRCNFCSTTKCWGFRLRPRTIKSVVDEIQMLQDKYGYNAFYIFDDSFTSNKRRVFEFCDEILKRNLKIKWYCSSRVSDLNEQIIKKIKMAGCVFIGLGVESGSQRLLLKMKKAINLNHIIESKKLCEKYNLEKKYWFIYGHPTETRSELKETVKLFHRLDAQISATSYMRIFPGTEIEKIAKEEGYLPNDFSWSEDYYPLNADKIKDPIDTGNIYYVPNSLSVEDMLKAMKAPLFFSGDIFEIRIIKAFFRQNGYYYGLIKIIEQIIVYFINRNFAFYLIVKRIFGRRITKSQY